MAATVRKMSIEIWIVVLALFLLAGAESTIRRETLKVPELFKPIEGNIFLHQCNTTLRTAFWTNKADFSKKEKILSFLNISRTNSGLYYCFKTDKQEDLLQTISIDVQYPAKILWVSKGNSPLHENQTFSVGVKVEGHPEPNTTLISVEDGTVSWDHIGEGNITADKERVQCNDAGPYLLMTINDIGNDTRTEEIQVYCPPAPNYGLSHIFKPRLGYDVLLVMENTGYPYPQYIWTFNGKVLANRTRKNIDTYGIKNVKIADFGVYTVTMSNNLGSTQYNYTVVADGPPDPATSLSVNNVTSISANLSFISGYDYGAIQNFIIQSFNGETYDDLAHIEDKPGTHKPTNVSHVLSDLTFGTMYNLTVLSNNSRGESHRSSSFVLFTTKVPSQVLAAKEGDTVTLKCDASNTTDIHWEDNNGTRLTTGEELDIANITRNYTGHYKCIGKTDFITIRVLEDVFIDVLYPAKILNTSVDNNYLKQNETYEMQLVVEGNPSPNITFINIRENHVEFHKNQTGALKIRMNSVDCANLGSYNLIVSNQVGSENKKEDIYVYCPPVVDSKAHVQKTFYPRLGNHAHIMIENFGYPFPNYTWTHNKSEIMRHEDSNFSSSIDITTKVESFGSYDVDMSNEYGDFDVSFQIIAEGPPDPVTDMKVDSFTYNSVNFSWTSGFNYDSPQTFMLQREQNGKYVNFKSFPDHSDHGLQKGNYAVTDLDSSTPYKFTVVSTNKNGTSEMPKGVLQFSTSASPTHHKSNKAAIIGGVIGGLCFLGLLVCAAVFWKRKVRRDRMRYRSLEE